MKTTFDIPESLLRDVQALARERSTTTKSLVEQALRTLLAEHDAAREPFVLRDASFKGALGVADEVRDMDAARMRELAYE